MSPPEEEIGKQTSEPAVADGSIRSLIAVRFNEDDVSEDEISVDYETARGSAHSNVTSATTATCATSATSATNLSIETGEDSIMETVQRRIDRLTNFERNFAPVLRQNEGMASPPGSLPSQEVKQSIVSVVDDSAGMHMKELYSHRSQSKQMTFSFRTAVTVSITIFTVGVCLGLFLPVALLSENARDELLASYLLVVGQHRQLVDELLQASLLSEALVQRLSNSASYVENLARAAQEQSEDCTHTVRIFGIVFFILLVPVSIIFAATLSWLLSKGWKALKFLVVDAGELASSKDSEVLRRLRRGNRSRMWDVADLQDCFISIARGMEAFVRFVPETTVRNILQGDLKATRLHVSRRNVTIMFSDIKDFTSISEALNQHDLLFLLTRYFSVMTRIVSSFDGVVAEILGDGLLCFWNTPDDTEDHAAKACAAALAMNQALELISSEFGKLQLPSLAIRIGIHTGSVLTGNIGSELKMKFGCMGDPVNLAARLEGLCKFYKVSILCSGETWRALPKRGFTCRRIDLVQVKGKTDPTEIYEVIDCQLAEPEVMETHTEITDKTSDWDGAGRVLPDRMRTVRKSIGKSFHVTDAANGCAPNVRGHPRCTLHLAVALEAIDDSSKAMSNSQSCTLIWEPLRRKFDALKIGLDQVKHAASLLKSGSGSSNKVDAGAQKGSAPARRKVPRHVRTVTGRSSQVISEDMSENTESRRVQILLYEDALQAYQDARFVAARDLLDELLGQKPEDGPALRLRERCGKYINANGRYVGLSLEALAEWTGVYAMTDK